MTVEKIRTVEEYVESCVHGFVSDPPDTDYQLGFLGAMLVLAEEALGLRMDLPPFAEAHELRRTAKNARRNSRQKEDAA
jgi:hypothetical protein